ncbi:MAG: hypothetical protein R3C59_03285 [Planctomycetaceae bacterium]
MLGFCGDGLAGIGRFGKTNPQIGRNRLDKNREIHRFSALRNPLQTAAANFGDAAKDASQVTQVAIIHQFVALWLQEMTLFLSCCDTTSLCGMVACPGFWGNQDGWLTGDVLGPPGGNRTSKSGGILPVDSERGSGRARRLEVSVGQVSEERLKGSLLETRIVCVSLMPFHECGFPQPDFLNRKCCIIRTMIMARSYHLGSRCAFPGGFRFDGSDAWPVLKIHMIFLLGSQTCLSTHGFQRQNDTSFTAR